MHDEPKGGNPMTEQRQFTLDALRRLKSSDAGNPRYSLTLTDPATGDTLKMTTKPNAMFAYAVDDSWVGRRVIVTTTRVRRLLAIDVSPTCSYCGEPHADGSCIGEDERGGGWGGRP